MSDPIPQRNALLQLAAQSARHRLATAIGYFSIEFADMESKLNALIHELLGLEPDTGHALTSAIMSVSTRLDILATLGRELDSAKPHSRTIELAHSEAVAVNGYRNWLLHDNWAGSVSTDGIQWEHQKRRMRPAGAGRKWQHGNFTEDAIVKEAARCGAVVLLVQPVLASFSEKRVARK